MGDIFIKKCKNKSDESLKELASLDIMEVSSIIKESLDEVDRLMSEDLDYVPCPLETNNIRDILIDSLIVREELKDIIKDNESIQSVLMIRELNK